MEASGKDDPRWNIEKKKKKKLPGAPSHQKKGAPKVAGCISDSRLFSVYSIFYLAPLPPPPLVSQLYSFNTTNLPQAEKKKKKAR
jgi:hypothetical protein